MTQSPAAGLPLGLGVFPYTIYATDAAGNVRNCTTSFSVIDNTLPNAYFTPEVTLYVSDICRVSAGNINLYAFGNDTCGPVVLTQNIPGNTQLTTGVTILGGTVIDGTGNFVNFNVTLNVLDIIDPVIRCNQNRTIVGVEDYYYAVPNLLHTLFVEDNCGVDSISQYPLPGTELPHGIHNLTFTVIDVHGNQAQCITQ